MCCALHVKEQWKGSQPRGANDVSQYGGIANRHVACAGAMGNVNNNLNAVCSHEVLSSFVADGGQVELFVVVRACEEHQALALYRCLRLTGTYRHIYIHTYKRGMTTHCDYLPSRN